MNKSSLEKPGFPRENPDPLGYDDILLFSEDLRRHAFGEFSMAVVHASIGIRDRSHVEVGQKATFVGVYDGHRGTDASKYVDQHLYDHLIRLARESGEISENIIRNAIAETERGYLRSVRCRQEGLGVGTSCLVGVIWKRRLYVGNLGDSRTVLCVLKSQKIYAQQVTEDHNANSQNIRNELQAQHLGNPDITLEANGNWRIRGVLEVTRAIGDFDLKYQVPAGVLGERLPRPYIRDDPQLHDIELNEDVKFIIFASHGLWHWIDNEEAINIVRNSPREGIARRLAVIAMEKAARKSGMTYTDLRDKYAWERKDFHDDFTVVVVYIDSPDPLGHLLSGRITTRAVNSIRCSPLQF